MTKRRDQALIVFMKNPIPGKVKSRLAATIGNEHALNVYLSLLNYTKAYLSNIDIDIYWYINESPDSKFADSFFTEQDQIKIQKGDSLGQKMSNAFEELFEKGFASSCIIGTDCPYINEQSIEEAFVELSTADFVIGPAKDGGYYLLGMNQFEPNLFTEIEWSTDNVFQKTVLKIQDLKKTYSALATLSDIDNEDDARAANLI